MAGINPEVTLSGKLFTAPDATLNYHVGVMTKELAREAETAIKFQGQTSFRYENVPEGYQRGTWSRHIKTAAAAIGHLKGWKVHDSGIIYGPWLEGEGTRNKTSRFKGYHTFRKVAQQIDRKAPQLLSSETRRMARDLER